MNCDSACSFSNGTERLEVSEISNSLAGVVLCFCVVCALGCGGNRGNDVTAREDAVHLMEALKTEALDAPSGCRLVDVTEIGHLGVKENPYLSSNRSNATTILVSRMFGEMFDSDAVQEVLYSLYREKAEIGFLAFRFSDEKGSRAAYERLRSGSKAQVFRKGTIVVYLWNDGVSSALVAKFRRKIKLVLNGGA